MVWESVFRGIGEAVEFAVDLARGRLYLTRNTSVTPTCSLHAFDLETGAVVWEMGLQGVGHPDHSKYTNSVRVKLLSGGDVVVFGSEEHGRYIEVVDAASGKTKAHSAVFNR